MIVTSFQPWHALLGGVSLGILSAGKTLITSRVLGISGTVKCATTHFAMQPCCPMRCTVLGGTVYQIGDGSALGCATQSAACNKIECIDNRHTVRIMRVITAVIAPDCLRRACDCNIVRTSLPASAC